MGRRLLGVVAALLLLPAAATAATPRTDGSVPAPTQIAQEVTHVPASTLNKVGAGEISGPKFFNIYRLHQQFASHGKPKVLTMNFAWCPHCAANNWSLAIALSRFGTLSNLRVINSGTYYCKFSHDPCTLQVFPCYPNTHGLSFFDAGFKSAYLKFTHVVLQDKKGHNLQQPTAGERRATLPWDPFEATPAVDVGGGWAFLNSGFDPGVLAHKSWAQIATSLAVPSSKIAKHVDGLANLFTAAICKSTHGKPGSVCKSHGVRAAARANLHGGPPPPPPPGAP